MHQLWTPELWVHTRTVVGGMVWNWRKQRWTYLVKRRPRPGAV
jgi:hypothetical protein